jgi:hypothetical protein
MKEALRHSHDDLDDDEDNEDVENREKGKGSVDVSRSSKPHNGMNGAAKKEGKKHDHVQFDSRNVKIYDAKDEGNEDDDEDEDEDEGEDEGEDEDEMEADQKEDTADDLSVDKLELS